MWLPPEKAGITELSCVDLTSAWSSTVTCQVDSCRGLLSWPWILTVCIGQARPYKNSLLA